MKKMAGLVCSTIRGKTWNKINLVEQTKHVSHGLFYEPTALNAHKQLEIASTLL